MNTPAKTRFDLPTIEAETRPFWDAARNGQLLIARCGACGRAHYYPRPFCIHCWSDDVTLAPASGRGELYTHSTVHVNDLPPFNERVPYVAAIVDLEEGPRISTNIVDCAPGALQVGMAVTLRFLAISDDITLPVFGPAEGR